MPSQIKNVCMLYCNQKQTCLYLTWEKGNGENPEANIVQGPRVGNPFPA